MVKTKLAYILTKYSMLQTWQMNGNCISALPSVLSVSSVGPISREMKQGEDFLLVSLSTKQNLICKKNQLTEVSQDLPGQTGSTQQSGPVNLPSQKEMSHV